ncbi:hypothetical protein J25TS5_30200 [Paenibacillus faecis]|nr:hypothetical protein J25TS5_30200 [Paenibacillus faecis]
MSNMIGLRCLVTVGDKGKLELGHVRLGEGRPSLGVGRGDGWAWMGSGWDLSGRLTGKTPVK